jgi:hypothetical protein
MWSDTLLAAERTYLVRLAIWGVTSAVAGTALIALVTLRRITAPIIAQFAVQAVAWGSVNLAVATVAWRRLAMRDLSAATRLDRVIWLSAGLDVGLVGVGVSLAVTGWALGRRLGLVGAGIGAIVQGLALLLVHLTFLSVLGRLI